MRYPPDCDYDQQELARLNAAPWMVDALNLNPSYLGWGPYEDYMWRRGRDEGPDDLGRTQDHGWESRVLVESWKDFGWNLNDLNECVNFYFEIDRDSKECPTCCGSGYHPDAQWVSESFYRHSSPFCQSTQRELEAEAVLVGFGGRYSSNPHGKGVNPDAETLSRYGEPFRQFCEEMRTRHCWGDGALTEDEEKALVDAGRSRDKMLGHDAINRGILIEARLKRLGLPKDCPQCDGHGEVFTEPAAHLGLVLWMLHPRKGCSRGVHIKHLRKDDLPKAVAWLKKAAERNAERFASVVV